MDKIFLTQTDMASNGGMLSAVEKTAEFENDRENLSPVEYQNMDCNVQSVVNKAEELSEETAEKNDKRENLSCTLDERCVCQTEAIKQQEKDLSELSVEIEKIRSLNQALDKELDDSRRMNLAAVEELSSEDTEVNQLVMDLNSDIQACGVDSGGTAVLSVVNELESAKKCSMIMKAKNLRIKTWAKSVKEKLKLHKTSLEGEIQKEEESFEKERAQLMDVFRGLENEFQQMKEKKGQNPRVADELGESRDRLTEVERKNRATKTEIRELCILRAQYQEEIERLTNEANETLPQAEKCMALKLKSMEKQHKGCLAGVWRKITGRR